MEKEMQWKKDELDTGRFGLYHYRENDYPLRDLDVDDQKKVIYNANLFKYMCSVNKKWIGLGLKIDAPMTRIGGYHLASFDNTFMVPNSGHPLYCDVLKVAENSQNKEKTYLRFHSPFGFKEIPNFDEIEKYRLVEDDDMRKKRDQAGVIKSELVASVTKCERVREIDPVAIEDRTKNFYTESRRLEPYLFHQLFRIYRSEASG